MRNGRLPGVALLVSILCGVAMAAPAEARQQNFCGVVAKTPGGCLVVRSHTGGRGYDIAGASPSPHPGTIITGSGALGGRSRCRAMYTRLTSVTWRRVHNCSHAA